MNELVRVCMSDVVYILGLSPFNYIVGLFLLSSIIYVIFYILKGGGK
jgi:hypothetical protein